jgi:hypothetical protein
VTEIKTLEDWHLCARLLRAQGYALNWSGNNGHPEFHTSFFLADRLSVEVMTSNPEVEAAIIGYNRGK